MKVRDIEKRLQEVLPLFTNSFTDEVTIVSNVPSGTTATVTTSAAHGITAGRRALIVGCDTPVGIDTIARVATIATVVTLQDHDLTQNYIDQPTVTLSGANESEFNGIFTLLTVPDRRTFTFEIADSGATSSTGTPILETPGLPFGYNGLVTVDATPTTTTFEYTLPQALTVPATGDSMRVIRGIRIHSAINEARAREVFEPKDLNALANGEMALFVILGDMQANRDRTALSDSISSAGVSGDNRQKTIQTVSCVIYQKVTNDTSGANSADEMQDIARHVIGSLAGWAPTDIGFAVDSGNKLRFVSHGLLEYDTAIYSHVVEFQLVCDISNEDLQITPQNVAFRDINFSFTNEIGGQILSATVDLDDVPL